MLGNCTLGSMKYGGFSKYPTISKLSTTNEGVGRGTSTVTVHKIITSDNQAVGETKSTVARTVSVIANNQAVGESTSDLVVHKAVYSQNIYSDRWNPILVDVDITMSQLVSSLSPADITFIGRWNRNEQKYDVFKADLNINADIIIKAGEAVVVRSSGNAVVSRAATQVSRWDIVDGWNLEGLDSTPKTLSQINDCINEGTCSADRLVYTSPITQTDNPYDCGLPDNANVSVGQGDGYWVYTMTKTQKDRVWKEQ